ncbi:hypothetical protein SDC9_137625 [bioreactor metagenome]|uniref:Uncharacterized protein n=1 Tax=bioreactor metagenome TaxID=1076179 RepID=A0A645DM25_9ZZZZ
MCMSYFDVVAKDFIVSNFKGTNTSIISLASFQVLDPLLAITGYLVQII